VAEALSRVGRSAAGSSTRAFGADTPRAAAPGVHGLKTRRNPWYNALPLHAIIAFFLDALRRVYDLARHRLGSVGVVVLCLSLAVPAGAQIDDRLEAYTGRNASGYLAPLVDAFRSNLNSGLFHSARIERDGFHTSLEFNVMSTFFDEEAREFWAVTESGFTPEQYVKAPTVVGDPSAVFVAGTASTHFAFPGGFDVDHMYLSCAQLRVGNWKGTEAVGRLILYDTGESAVGQLGVWGAGLRHSVSQYTARLAPFDLALAGMWQHAQLHNDAGLDVIESELFTLALHSGVALGSLYPYAGLAIDWYRFDVHYEVDGTAPVDLSFRANEDFQLTLGVSYQVGFIAAYGEYNVADQNSLAAGLSVDFPFSSRSVTQ
jgi:hypothetical protein